VYLREQHKWLPIEKAGRLPLVRIDDHRIAQGFARRLVALVWRYRAPPILFLLQARQEVAGWGNWKKINKWELIIKNRVDHANEGGLLLHDLAADILQEFWCLSVRGRAVSLH